MIESYIEYHTAPVPLPYDVINKDQTFGIFTLKLEKTSIRTGPFQFTFMIDVTLSMSECDETGKTKMEYMQKTMVKMLEYMLTLEPDIYVTIYTFHTEVKHVVLDVLLTRDSVTNISEMINKLEADDSTDIESALKGLIHSSESTHQNVNIFMTDGEANVGMTDPDKLVGLINDSIPHVFIGFGKNHNSQMLQTFGKQKNCEYYFVDNLENSVLVYAESIYNILYGVISDVTFRVEYGELYDYETNEWTTTLHENMLSSECHKIYQLKTENPHLVEVHVTGKSTSAAATSDADTVYDILPDANDVITYVSVPLPDLCDEDDVVDTRDFTVYAFRQKVQQLMYLAKESRSDIMFRENTDNTNLKQELKQVYQDIKEYDDRLSESEKSSDGNKGILKMLCEDIYVTKKSLDMGRYRNMYVGARQTSQGRQRSYNVGKNIPDTIQYDNIPGLRRQSDYDEEDDDTYVLDHNTTTCFASPTMLSTFRDVSQM